MPSKAASAAEPYAARRAAGTASREATRARLLTAADELFRQDGYVGTTVSAIAGRAGVSLQTLYLAWGSKTALFRAAADATATATDSNTPLGPDAWREHIDRQLSEATGPHPSARDYLGQVAKIFTAVAARSSVYWQMQPAASASDPEIAAGVTETMTQRRNTLQRVAAGIPSQGLRHGLHDDYIADTLWTLASPETYALLTGTAGYTATAYTDWLTTTLAAALCTDIEN